MKSHSPKLKSYKSTGLLVGFNKVWRKVWSIFVN